MAKARGYAALRAGATSGSWEPEERMSRRAKNMASALADAQKTARAQLIAEGKRKQKAADEAVARSNEENRTRSIIEKQGKRIEDEKKAKKKAAEKKARAQGN